MPNDEDSGATSSRGLAHGQLCYLQIPAKDIRKSAEFYAKVFGWQTDPEHPSFEAPGLIGQWVTDRPSVPDAGLLAWISVEHIDDALEQIRKSGGDVLEPPSPDGPRWLSTIRDPGGNAVGIAQHGPRLNQSTGRTK